MCLMCLCLHGSMCVCCSSLYVWGVVGFMFVFYVCWYVLHGVILCAYVLITCLCASMCIGWYAFLCVYVICLYVCICVYGCYAVIGMVIWLSMCLCVYMLCLVVMLIYVYVLMCVSRVYDGSCESTLFCVCLVCV